MCVIIYANEKKEVFRCIPLIYTIIQKFSYDGSNTPEEIIENAIRHGVDVIGITDHQFSIGEDLPIYYEYIQHCKIKYADKIKSSLRS